MSLPAASSTREVFSVFCVVSGKTVFEAAPQSLVIVQPVTLKSPARSGVVFRAKPTGISEPNQARHVQNLCRNQLSGFQSICDKGSLGVRLRILYRRQSYLSILWNLSAEDPWMIRSILILRRRLSWSG